MWCRVLLATVLVSACSNGAPAPSATPAATRPTTPPPTTRSVAPRPAGVPLPTVMAALGDSLTRAFNLCPGITDCPAESWATGTATDSHYARLRRLGARLTAHNLAISGATVYSLPAQAEAAVRARADYVTVLVGTNDACTGREAYMTPVDVYEREFSRAMDTLARGGARVLVGSVPDVMRLWEVGHRDDRVRRIWRETRLCRSMLDDSASTDRDDAARRARVRDRVVAYNDVMARACARHARCRWDGGAVFAEPFGLDALSERDAFHPSRAGQRRLADVTWRAGWWA